MVTVVKLLNSFNLLPRINHSEPFTEILAERTSKVNNSFTIRLETEAGSPVYVYSLNKWIHVLWWRDFITGSHIFITLLFSVFDLIFNGALAMSTHIHTLFFILKGVPMNMFCCSSIKDCITFEELFESSSNEILNWTYIEFKMSIIVL